MFDSFNSFFKTLVDHEVTVELKNDIQIRGTLKSVDQYLNIKLDDIQVVEELKYPHLVSTRAQAQEAFNCVGGIHGEPLLMMGLIVIGQECFHQRERGQICAFTWRCGRYGAVRRW
jgi:small nuclear ribonucleoprotein (snRNP)-like protein